MNDGTTIEQDPASKKRARWRSPRANIKAAALILSFAIVAAPLVAPGEPAEAAVRLYGFQGGSGAGAGWLGNVNVNGAVAYCIDPAGFFPSAASGGGTLVSSFAGTTSSANPGHNGTRTVSGTDITKLNYALNTFSPGANTNVAAAGLAAYVNSITSSLHPGDGVYYYIDIRVTNLANRNAVKAQYQAIKANVEANWYKETGTNTASLSITMDPEPSIEGTLNVTANPASATGTATLSNAVFTATGLSTASVTNGSSLRVTGIPPADGSTYSIAANATFTAPTTYAQAVTIYYTGTTAQQQQRVIGPGPKNTGTFSAAAFVTDPLPNEFEPIVVTEAQDTILNPGDPVIDKLTATVEDPANFPWRSSSTGPYEVKAVGTLYGPFTDKPSPSATVPAGAPVAGTEEVLLAGPGDYFTSGSVVVTQSGYYTWVWVIDELDQTPRVQLQLPDGYLWEDQFGLDAETSVVRVQATVETAVDDDEVGLFVPVADSVEVLHDPTTGAWFTEVILGGDVPVSVTFEGTAYWVPGDVQPALAAAPPTSAVTIGTAMLTVSSPGTYSPPAAVLASPFAGNGWIVWQWTITNSNGLFQDWSEMFGEPSQMARVLAPSLETQATAQVDFTHPATDTATIAGEETGEDVYLSFAAYLQEDGQPADCSVDAEVFNSSATPIALTAPGDYTSPEVTFDEVGTYFWVATLAAADGTVIAEGTCGDPDEITEVVPPTMTTEAEPSVALTDTAHDVAIVAGATMLDPGQLSFAAYLQQDGQPADCSVGAQVYDSSAAPISVTAPGRYQSPSVTFAIAGTYLWIATLRSAGGDVIAQGACGDPNEVTAVTEMEISTKATTIVAFGTMATDTATVVGATPLGSTIAFAAFLQDEGSSTPSCTTANRVFDGAPIALTGAGDYESQEVRFTQDGTYFWVATAYDRDGNVLWEGACGDPAEVTSVITQLVVTGIEAAGPFIIGLLLLLAGVAAVVVVRRRRGEVVPA